MTGLCLQSFLFFRQLRGWLNPVFIFLNVPHGTLVTDKVPALERAMLLLVVEWVAASSLAGCSVED